MAGAEKTAPQEAVAAYQNFRREHPKLDATTEVAVAVAIAQLQYHALKDASGALETYRAAILVSGDSETTLPLLQEAGNLLMAERKFEEALELYNSRSEQILSVSPVMASKVLQQYVRVLRSAGQSRRIPQVLQEVLWQKPALLDDGTQSRPIFGAVGTEVALLNEYNRWGWMYETMSQELVKQGKIDESLAWAKVRFATCGYEPGSIDRAGRQLGKLFNLKDPSGKLAQEFIAAQRDPQVPNPLTAIPLPVVGEETPEQFQQILDFTGSPADRISLYLIRGQVREAMVEACQGLMATGTQSSASRQVGRVFKATDGDLRRANAFLSYYSKKGDSNPLSEFWGQEIPEQLVEILKKQGTGTSESSVSDLTILAPIKISLLKSKVLTPDDAWKSGMLKSDEVIYMLTWGGIVDGPGQPENKNLRTHLAGLLVRFAPETIPSPALNQNTNLAVADYYRSQANPKAESVYLAILSQAGPVRNAQGQLTYSSRPWFFEPTVNRLAEYYATVGTPGKAQELWQSVERSPVQDASLIGVAALETARLMRDTGDYQAALQHYKRAEESGYSWAAGLAIWDQSYLLMEAGQHDDARQLLQKVNVVEHGTFMQVLALSALANSYFRVGDLPLARKHAVQCLAQYNAMNTPAADQGMSTQIAVMKGMLEMIERWEKLPVPVLVEPAEIRRSVTRSNEPFVQQVVLRSLRPLVSKVASNSELVKIRSLTDKPTYSGTLGYSTVVELKIPADNLNTSLEFRTPEYPESIIRVPIVVQVRKDKEAMEKIDVITVE